MTVTENYIGCSPTRLFSYAEREKNTKRKGLIVNRYQGKHIPVSPSKATELFRCLAGRIPYEDNTAVIGFAETATAIGAQIAESIGSRIYIHTSRENIPEKFRLITFSEEHSHAVEQNLFSDKGQALFSGIKKIIFADDEITTGKTILNLSECLREKVAPDCKFAAASIINGMNEENIDKFRNNGIELYYLMKIQDSLSDLSEKYASSQENDLPLGIDRKYLYIRYKKIPDPRLGVNTSEYISACREAVNNITLQLSEHLKNCKAIDFIGTEEFMYPVIKLGEEYENKGFECTTHSTTRSPIVPCRRENYPLFSRAKLRSFYDRERTTYLYNIRKTDAAVIFTDTKNFSEETAAELSSVLMSDKIFFVIPNN